MFQNFFVALSSIYLQMRKKKYAEGFGACTVPFVGKVDVVGAPQRKIHAVT